MDLFKKAAPKPAAPQWKSKRVEINYDTYQITLGEEFSPLTVSYETNSGTVTMHQRFSGMVFIKVDELGALVGALTELSQKIDAAHEGGKRGED